MRRATGAWLARCVAALMVTVSAYAAKVQPMQQPMRPEAAIPAVPDALRQHLDLSFAQLNALAHLRERLRQEQGRLSEQAASAAGSAESAQLRAVARYRQNFRAQLSPAQRSRLARLEAADAPHPAALQAQCFWLLPKRKPPEDPAACAEFQREP